MKSLNYNYSNLNPKTQVLMPKIHDQSNIANNFEYPNQQIQEFQDPKTPFEKESPEVEPERHNPELNNGPKPQETESAQTANKLTQKKNSSLSWKTIFLTLLIFVLLTVITAGCVFTVTQNTKLINQLQELKTTVGILEQKASQIPKAVTNTAAVNDTTPLAKWVYFDAPRSIPSFNYQNTRENIMKFDEVIPRSIKTKQVKFILVMSQCGVTAWNDYWVKIKAISNKGQDYHFTWGISSPFGHCLWNSEMVTLDIEETRQLRVQANLVLRNIDLRFYFVGYSCEP